MPSLEAMWRQVRWSVASRGLGGTAALAVRRLAGRDPGAVAKPWPVHPFDTENGVETGGHIGGSHLGAGHAHDLYNVAYQGIPPSRLHNAIRQWRDVVEREPGARPIEEYAFFDIGCGKGRALMLASELPFREVGGVELDPGLARIGQQNLDAWHALGKAQRTVSLHAGDATEVPLPEPPVVFWMYNPFRAPVVRKMLERFNQHAGARAGQMDVIYLIPNESAEFAAAPGFRRLWEGTVRMSEYDQQWEDSDAEDKAEIWQR